MNSEKTTNAGSTLGRVFFRVLFSTGPMFRLVRKRRPMPPVEEITVVGRRTGRERRVLVQLIETSGRTYVFEPSGLKSAWVDNLAAAGRCVVTTWDGTQRRVRAVELERGAERDEALAALPWPQPLPLRFFYQRASGHIDAVGRFFRLDDEQPGDAK